MLRHRHEAKMVDHRREDCTDRASQRLARLPCSPGTECPLKGKFSCGANPAAQSTGLDDDDRRPMLLQNLDQLLAVGRETHHLPRRLGGLVNADHALVFAEMDAQNETV